MAEPDTTIDDYKIVAFVNGKSGGKLGSKVIDKLSKLIPAEDVYDLMDKPIGPEKGLTKYKDLSKVKLIAAGGDGTVAWLLSALDKMKLDPDKYPVVGVLPLGTGNDMARILKWGGGYSGGELKTFAANVKNHATTIKLDRWKVDIVPLKPEEVDEDCESASEAEGAENAKKPEKKAKKPKKSKTPVEDPGELHLVCNNYFSIGIGAAIIGDYEDFRNKHPSLVTSATIGKGWYGLLSASRMVKKTSSLRKVFTVNIDGKQQVIPKVVQEYTLLNIPSIMGGSDAWGKYTNLKGQDFEPRVNDKAFEVVGYKGVAHLGRVKAGLSVHGALRLGQGKKMEIVTQRCLSAQIDGEHLMLPPCKITITHHNQSNMLLNMVKDTDKKWYNKLVSPTP